MKLQSNPYFLLCKKRCPFFIVGFLVLNVFNSYGQTTYIWNAATTNWTTSTNWTPTRTTPATNDILLFNNGATNTITNIPIETVGQLVITNNTTINLKAGAAGNVLTLSGVAGSDDLSIAFGSALNINGSNALSIFVGSGATGNIVGNITFSVADHRLDAADAMAINFYSPSVFTQDNGCTGNVFTASGTANAIVFNSGTTFVQNAGGAPFALTQPQSKVIFKTGNLFKKQDNLILSFSGRTYADLEINYSAYSLPSTGTNLLTIDNLTVTQGQLNLNLTTAGINIKGNIFVAAGAALNFNPASASTLVLNGTTPQSITNLGTLNFGSNETVNFNNPAGFIINNNMTLNNTVNFTSGVVSVPNTNKLILSATANVTSVSNNSFVDGLVQKIGNTAFTFPVGKAGIGYVPVSISAPANITDAFTAAYVRSSAIVAFGNNYTTGLNHVSNVDYFILDRTTGTSTLNITLNWTAQSSNNGAANYINNLSTLTIAHYNSATSNWDNFGGVATGSVVAGSITWANVNSFSPFSLASTDNLNPLPITINYFKANLQANNNYLSWSLNCSNSDNLIINVQHSIDAANFENIKNIVANNLVGPQVFNFSDNNFSDGINYYRLKIIATDGKIIYSNTLSLANKIPEEDKINILPNIVQSNATLLIRALQNKKMFVVVTDIVGRPMQTISYNLAKGNNPFTLNLQNLIAGVYQISGYTANQKPITIRFVKQ